MFGCWYQFGELWFHVVVCSLHRRECRPTVIWNTGTELIEKAAKAEKAAATVPSSTAPTVAPTAVAPVVAVEPPSISLSIITDTEHSLVGPGTPGTPATPGLSYQEAYPCFSLDEVRTSMCNPNLW